MAAERHLASARPASAAASIPEVLADLYGSGQRSVSFEFFPPRDDEGEAVLWEAIRRLEPLGPHFVSVTYGAGGSTRDRTTRITGKIARETTLTPMAHLTCVGASRAQLRQVIGGFAASGVRNILAVRGDPPGGPGTAWTAHPEGLDHALDLVRLVRDLGRFSVGVAAAPQGHPESPDLDHDARVLAMKAEAGAQFAITQFFFESGDYFRFLDRLAAHGAELPVIPGIMPLTSIKQVERFAVLSGTPMPRHQLARIEAVADDPAAVRAVGLDLATELCEKLLDGGAPGLHFFTLNRSTATIEIYNRLRIAERPQAGARAS